MDTDEQREQSAQEEAGTEEVPQGPVTPVEPEPEPEPEQNKVQVQCGGCKRNFELPVPPNTIGFEFDCTACGAHNQVEL